ncbi:MAG TPA: helix-turn-helix domain-containing protein [Amycolatopsis sp.]|nr:helix-turn-helix domain-containing protein [Amycolatopsis sp.]
MPTTVGGQWVRELRPDGPMQVEPVCEHDTIERAVAQVGEGAVDWAVQTGHRMALRAIRLEPQFGWSDGAVRTLRLGTEAAAIWTLVGIDAGALRKPEIPAETQPMVREYVHRRISLERIWASIRLGHSWFGEYYMSACRELVPREEQPEQLELVSRVLFEFVNSFSAGVGEAYHEEEERWVTSAAAARDETVQAILAGEEIDPLAASHQLRYDLAHQHHIGLIFCQEGTDAADTTALHRLAGTVLTALGATSTLIMPVGRTELWAWGAAPKPFSDWESAAADVDLNGVRAVAGTPGRGVDGFRRTHAEAQEAARVVLLTGPAAEGVISYPSVSLLALLTADPGLARAFLHTELDRLATDDPATATLRTTLLAFLEHRRSPQSTASALFVAKNTVVYRVKRAEELLGRSIDVRQPELWTALLLARGIGVGPEPEEQPPRPATAPHSSTAGAGPRLSRVVTTRRRVTTRAAPAAVRPGHRA